MTVYMFLINGTCQYVEYLLHKSNIVMNVLLRFLWSVLPRFLLFDLILYVPSTIFQLNRDGSSCVEPVKVS